MRSQGEDQRELSSNTTGLGVVDPADAALRVLGMDGMPPPELDRYLDATARCITRYGLGRVSVQDVARELGVDRTTVYRQVGTVKRQLRLLAAREIGRILAAVPVGEAPVSVSEFVENMAKVVEAARAHPVLTRIMRRDADVLTLADLGQIQRSLVSSAKALVPLVSVAMDKGWLADRDPEVIASWTVQTVVWLVLTPPAGDTREILAQIAVPVLEPPGARPGVQATAQVAPNHAGANHRTVNHKTNRQG